MAEEKQSVMDAVADLEERNFAERTKRRRARIDKLSEGKSKRFRRRMERMELARGEYDMVKVRVHPRDDEMRKVLVHTVGRIAFHETGSVEWPLDSFTEKRLRSGEVTLESQADSETRQQRRASSSPRPPTTPAA